MTGREITCFDPLDVNWTALTVAHPDSTIFHHPAWMNLLNTCYGYQPMRFAMLDGTCELVAGLPLMRIDSWLTGRRVVSLPFSDFCQPLTLNKDADAAVMYGLQSWRRQNNIPEIQIHWSIPESPGVYPGETFVRHVTHLDTDSRKVFCSFAKTQVQQRIHKAEREGIQIRQSNSWEDVRLFYRMHLKTRQRLGVPIQPMRFFRALWQQLISQGLGFVILAYKDSKLLAAAVFLHYNKTLTYKYGASDPLYWHLHPNNLILWKAICWGCEHGYQMLDWGRTDLENIGLREFKLGWGTEEQILRYSVLCDHPPNPSPVKKSKHLQTSFIQRSPVWMCSLIGELLYKHFG